MKKRILLVLATISLTATVAHWGSKLQKTPTHTDVPYGGHKVMALDFWQAKANTPTPLFVWIHGGGFRNGDKADINPVLLSKFLKAGVSVASINYRLTDIGPYPMQMLDSARAVQFLRAKASEWNIDPARVAAGGGSAGAGISQWLTFHEDLADPNSDDPIARQSTRLTCALAISMQSTYDPRSVSEIVPGISQIKEAMLAFYDLPDNWNLMTATITPDLDALFKDASPITHLTVDDQPVYIFHLENNRKPGDIHHPAFGEHLKAAMDKLDIECIQKTSVDYDGVYEDMVRFVLRQFRATAPDTTL